MNTNRVKYIRIAVSALGAGLALIVLLLALGGARTQAALLRNSGTGDDPEIRRITMTSDLPYYDPTGSKGITKTVYFSNCVAGTITMTFEISGTPTLTLTADATFGEGERTYTTASSPLVTDVVYTVSTTHGSQNHILYTAANGVTTTVAITYVRDITAPRANIFDPPPGYFTGTQLVITGTATDYGGCGVRRVQVMTDTTWVTATGTTTWACTTAVPITDGRPYILSVYAEDYLSIIQRPAVTQVITVDNVAPTGTVIFTPSLPVGQWVTTKTLNIQWAGFTDGDQITDYQYLITSTTAVTLPSTVGTFTTSTHVTETLHDDQWYFHVAAEDAAGNWSTAAYTGPFKVDTAPPLISSAVITEDSNYLHAVGIHLFYTDTMPILQVHQFLIGGTASDEGSGLARATFSPAFGDPPLEDTTPAAWKAKYGVSGGDGEDWSNGVITATLYDQVGMTNFRVFTYTLDGARPTSLVTATVEESSGKSPIEIDWYAKDNGCGVESVDLYYRTDGGPWSYDSIVTPTIIDLTGTFTFEPPTVPITGPITYEFASDATDHLGNVEGLPDEADAIVIVQPARLYLPLVMHNYPPRPEGNVVVEDGAAYVYTQSVTLSLTATVVGDNVEWIRINNNETALHDEPWEPISPTPVLNMTKPWELADGISGLRTVYAQFKGSKGGVSDPASDQVYLAWNGDFEDGWGSYWVHGQGSFGGNGSGLDQGIVPVDGSNRARLGNSASQDGHIRVGYAYIAQEFSVPAGNPHLSFDYRVISSDHVWGQKTHRYFDTFEVSINRPPGQISDQERDNQGCHDPSRLNPNGTLTPSGAGLVFCGGQPPTQPPLEWNSDWRQVTLDLSAFTPGQNITLYIATWSREYDPPWYNDQGYYNTYSYVDNVAMEGNW